MRLRWRTRRGSRPRLSENHRAHAEIRASATRPAAPRATHDLHPVCQLDEFGFRRGDVRGHHRGGALDVVARDASPGSCGLHRGEIDSELSGPFAGGRRRSDAAARVPCRASGFADWPGRGRAGGAADRDRSGCGDECRELLVAQLLVRTGDNGHGSADEDLAADWARRFSDRMPLAGASTSSTAFSVSTVSSGSAF